MPYLSLYLINFFFIFMLSNLLFMSAMWSLLNDMIYIIEWEITSIKSTSIIMTFLFDWMSMLFMSFVLFISSMVIFYSKEYMSEDKNANRFIFLILLFIFSMMMMIISPNLISILLGWDGLGLVSYCLVIYFQNIKSFNAGMVTALSNRIGDVTLLMSIAWMLNYGSWTYYFYLEMMKNDFEMTIILILVTLAAMTKSAQIPFSSWLPAAMAAPTPVSALVHSSTLVTAGVYLLIRFNLLLNLTMMSVILLLLGSLTMLMSGLGANYEMDLKKIIALSTLSQLGLMVGILSLGFYKLAFFHLLSHALFKALLFLCAGAFIHNMMNIQDIRVYGSLYNKMPLSMMCFNISSLALCGMPFLAGFYSKDLILEMILMSNINLIIFLIFFISTGLTVSYSFRLFFNSSIKPISTFSLLNLMDESWGMLKMMLNLSFMSIIGGSCLSWLMFPFPFFIFIPLYLKMLTLITCLLGGMVGYLINSIFKFYTLNYLNKYFLMKYFLSSMWFLPIITSLKLNYLFLKKGFKYMKSFDFGWSELLGGFYLFKLTMKFSNFYQKFQNNQLNLILISYFLIMMFTMMALITLI